MGIQKRARRFSLLPLPFLLLISLIGRSSFAQVRDPTSGSALPPPREIARLSQGVGRGGNSVAESARLGLSADTIMKLYGEPDKKSMREGDEMEIWHYGRSILLIADGFLVGLSDEGDLAERAEAHEFDTVTGNATVEFPEWKNLWTPKKAAKAEDMLDTVLPELFD